MGGPGPRDLMGGPGLMGSGGPRELMGGGEQMGRGPFGRSEEGSRDLMGGPGMMGNGLRGSMGGNDGQMGRGLMGGSGVGPRDFMDGPGLMDSGLRGSSAGMGMGGMSEMGSGGSGVLGAGLKAQDNSAMGQSRFRGSGGPASRDPMNGPRGPVSTSGSLLPDPQNSFSSTGRPLGSSFGDLDKPYGHSASSLGDIRDPPSRYLDPVDDWQRPLPSWSRGDEYSRRDPLDDPLYGQMRDMGRTSSLIEDRRYQPQSHSLDPYDRDPLPRDYDHPHLPMRDFY